MTAASGVALLLLLLLLRSHASALGSQQLNTPVSPLGCACCACGHHAPSPAFTKNSKKQKQCCYPRDPRRSLSTTLHTQNTHTLSPSLPLFLRLLALFLAPEALAELQGQTLSRLLRSSFIPEHHHHLLSLLEHTRHPGPALLVVAGHALAIRVGRGRVPVRVLGVPLLSGRGTSLVLPALRALAAAVRAVIRAMALAQADAAQLAIPGNVTLAA